MKKIYLVIFISTCWALNAQHILNGSFENNDMIHFLDSINATLNPELQDENAQFGCWFNLYEKDYNRLVDHSKIFKPIESSHLDTVPAVVSMHQTDCTYTFGDVWGPEAADGRWYTSVVTAHYFKIINNDFLNPIVEHHHDYLSVSNLEFSQALDSTKWYQLTYSIRDRPGTSFHNAAVEVGISRYDSTFGQTIHISQVPQHEEDWIHQSVAFKPQFAANHLSFKMRFPPNSMEYAYISPGDYSIRFYVFVDNFVLSELTSTDERVVSQTKLYPNPSNEELYIETTKGEYIQIADVLGKILHQEKILPHKKNAIWIDHLEQGNYILHILNKDGNFIENKKFIKL